MQPTVIINPADIARKLEEIEARTAQWEANAELRWETMEEDIQACSGIMVQEFSRLGRAIPAYIQHNDEILSAAWVGHVYAWCVQQHGQEQGTRIAGWVMERLASISRQMTEDAMDRSGRD